jgi:hypothetical protein
VAEKIEAVARTVVNKYNWFRSKFFFYKKSITVKNSALYLHFQTFKNFFFNNNNPCASFYYFYAPVEKVD